jgi:hypothetical protein
MRPVALFGLITSFEAMSEFITFTELQKTEGHVKLARAEAKRTIA